MELLKRQLLSPRSIQHSARLLFVLAQASAAEREQILEAVFNLSRDEIVKRLRAGTVKPEAFATRDYIYDVLPGGPAGKEELARTHNNK
jgi:malate synthase